jgi:hypothetical protein
LPPKLFALTPSDAAQPKKLLEDVAGNPSEIGNPDLRGKESSIPIYSHSSAPINHVLEDLVAFKPVPKDAGGTGEITDLEPSCLESAVDGIPNGPLKQLTIPAGGAADTVQPLTNGAVYTLIAWGDVQIQSNPPVRADTQYSDFSNPTANAGITVDTVNEFTPETAQTPLWGAYRPDHKYYLIGHSKGTIVHLQYPVSGTGSLFVDIHCGRVTPPPIPPECCSGTTDLADSAAPDTGGPAPAQFSANPVRAWDGVLKLENSDLASSGFGSWAFTRSFTNRNTYRSSGFAGGGILIPQQPYVLRGSLNGTPYVTVVSNGTTSRKFNDDGAGNLTPTFFLKDQLALLGGEYQLTDARGNVLKFFNVDTSVPEYKRGQIDSFTDSYGNVTNYLYFTSSDTTDTNKQNKVKEVDRTTAGPTTLEKYLYDYIPTGQQGAGLLASVTWQRPTGTGGAFVTVRSLAFSYYDGTENFGAAGDLKTVTLKDSAGNVIDTSYQRYFRQGDSDLGSARLASDLRMTLGPQSLARLQAAYPSTWSTIDNATAKPYADYSFQYDSDYRVTSETVQATGCSTAAGCTGQGTFTYSYTLGTSGGFNNWQFKTVVSGPDNNQNVYYTNSSGQVMLHAFFNPADTTKKWVDFYKYDEGTGRLLLHAKPSALIQYPTGETQAYYNDAYPDLLHNVSGNYAYLSNTAGLIEQTQYCTGAIDCGVNGASGYFKETDLLQGQTATIANGRLIPQRTVSYATNPSGNTVLFPSSESVYSGPNFAGPRTTSYAYTWFSNTPQIQSKTITKPIIADAQNGPNSADVQTTYFDRYERPIWTKDADGFIGYLAYDAATGGLVKTITDVDTTRTGDFDNSTKPAGWTTPPGGGLHLITTMAVDPLGRTTQLTEPNTAPFPQSTTYTVYRDANHEVRTYPGWHVDATLCPNGCPTGPTQVNREIRQFATTYTESLTMAALPSVTGGLPDGTESISAVQSLSRSYISSGGQVTKTAAYFSPAGLNLNTPALDIGTAGTVNADASITGNYWATQFQFDVLGRQNRVLAPTQTITRAVFDGLGRVVSAWIGTNDNGATDSDPTGGGATGNNMIKTTDNLYDAYTPATVSAVGDGDLTQVTVHPGGGAADRVTQNYFDWRNRTIASKSGVQASETDGTHRPIIFYDYDNLSEVTNTEQYDGDGYTSLPARPGATTLRAKRTSTFDNQGRVYRSDVYSVDPNNGSLANNTMKTYTWYSHRGQVIKTLSSGGLVTKNLYDGAGRITKSYQNDGASDPAPTVTGNWAAAGNVLGNNIFTQTET